MDAEEGDAALETLTIGVVVIVLLMFCTSVIVVNRGISAVHRRAHTTGITALADLAPDVKAEEIWNSQQAQYIAAGITCDPLTNVAVLAVGDAEMLTFDFECDVEAPVILPTYRIASVFNGVPQVND